MNSLKIAQLDSLKILFLGLLMKAAIILSKADNGG
jgi:hypothetical protein